MKGRESRGLLTPEMVASLSGATQEVLLAALDDADPARRTAAVHLLATQAELDDPLLTDVLMPRLAGESALYTRLCICDALAAKGGQRTAQCMLTALANTAPTPLATAPSKKRTYPLARSLIARTLGHMDPAILPALFDALFEGPQEQAREVIDAIGFLLYHNPTHATDEAYLCIVHAWSIAEDPVLRCKCITCLSAFASPACALMLHAIIACEEDARLQAEARRSLLFVT